MRRLKDNIINLYNLLESKDHLIDRLNLTPEQKEELKAFFKKYPNYESKIDWNKKDLTFEDFKGLLSNEGKSKSQAKKKGLEGITEGVDYRVLDQKEDFIAYQPLTYLGSVTIASNRVPPVKENGAKWCTAYQKTSKHWNDYTKKKGGRFCYVCTKDTKYALVLYPGLRQECYSFEDDKIHCPENLKYLYNILLDQVKKEKEAIETKYLLSLYKKWKKTGEVSIPEKYRKYITSITIPDSLTSIGANAFESCESLENIVIPVSVTNIGDKAFKGCESLKSITIPNSVISIGDRVFQGCKNLENIVIPDSVVSIGEDVFLDNRSLINITIPNSVTSIGDGAFFDCKSLENIVIPDSVTSIGEKAFFGCRSLKNLIIPDSVTSISSGAFWGCTNLENIVIPDSVTSIGTEVFWGCGSLKNITIPNSITSIGKSAFVWCTSLKSIIIPNSVTNIGDEAFWGCKNLKSITIPNSMTSIGNKAFVNCERLTIYYQGTREQWERIEGSDNIEKPVIFKKQNMMNKTLEHLNNYLLRFEENKDHLIDRLNLTDDQKSQLKAFFKKYPNYESKINWNRKDLTYKDFEFLLTNEGKSKSQAKKKGVSGLKEGVDYKVIGQGIAVNGEFGSANWEYAMYMPLTHLGSKTLASPTTLPAVTGEWCIAMNDDTWWQNYTTRTMDFFFILITEKGNPQNGYKFAVSRNSSELVSNLKQYGLEDVIGNLSLKDFPGEARTRYNLGKFWDDPNAPAEQRALAILDNSIDIFTAKDQCFSLFQLYCLPNDLFSSQLIDKSAWLALEGVIDKHLNDFLRVENEHTKRIASEKDYWLARMFNLNGTLNKNAVNNLGTACHSMQFTIDLKFPRNYPYKFFPEENTVEAELFDGTWDPDYDEFRGVSNADLWLGAIKKIDMSQVRQVHSIMEEAFANLPFEEFIPPASLQFIGTDAFTGCPGIKLLDFLKSKSLVVESLAFSYMYSLTTILFPHQLSLGSKVFNMATSLKDIWYDGTLSEFLDTFTEIEKGKVQETDLKTIITYLFGGAYRSINGIVIHCKDKRLTLNGAEIWEEANPEEKLNLLKKKKQQEEEDEDAIPF